MSRVSQQSEANVNQSTIHTAGLGTSSHNDKKENSTNPVGILETDSSPSYRSENVEFSIKPIPAQDVDNSTASTKSETLKTQPIPEAPNKIDVNPDTYAKESDAFTPAGVDQSTLNAKQDICRHNDVQPEVLQIPPPPRICPPNPLERIHTSSADDSGAIEGDLQAEKQQRLDRIAPRSGTEIDLGNKQLLRHQRPSQYLSQARTDGHTSNSNTNFPPPMSTMDQTILSSSHLPNSARCSRISPPWTPRIDHAYQPGWPNQNPTFAHSGPRMTADRSVVTSRLGQINSAFSQELIAGQTHFTPFYQPQQHGFSPRPPYPRALQQSPWSNTHPHHQSENFGQAANHHSQSEPHPRFTSIPRRRQRSASLQIMDVRPAQRPRLEGEFQRLNSTLSQQRVKVEEKEGPHNHKFQQPRRSTRSSQPHEREVQPSAIGEAGSGSSFSQQQADLSMRTRVIPSVERQSVPHRDDNKSSKLHRPATPVSQRAKSRRTMDEDYNDNESDIEEDENSAEADDELAVSSDRDKSQRREEDDFTDLADYDNNESSLSAGLALRTTFGAPKPLQRAPLPLEERHNLELRFCARVSMIIGSKRCVMAPVIQVSKTKNIFTIMRQKFGHFVEGEERK